MRVLVNGVRLYFDVEGAELVPEGPAMRRRPVVIALHGGPGADHTTLKPALSPLADIAQVIYIDQRGHGRSDDGDRARWSLAQLADDVVGFCAALDIERPIVYGQSFGATVALHYAIAHPAHPAALALVAATPTGHGRTIERAVRAFRRVGGDRAAEVHRRDIERPSAATEAEWLEVCLPYLSRHSPGRETTNARARTIERADVSLHYNRLTRDFDLREQLSTIVCPVLLVVGEHDPVTPVADAEDIATRIGGRARVVRVPDAAHTVSADQPDRVEAALRRFIAENSS